MFCYHCMREKGDAKICPHCQSETISNIPLHHLMPGTLLGGRYLIGEALGQGGFGITYIGYDTVLNVRVAVKEYFVCGVSNRSHTFSSVVSVMSGESMDSYAKGKERFLSEAQNIARFRGESGIVGVSDFIRENNTAYIVMEYLEGINLKNYLKQVGTLTPEQTINLLMPVMLSLEKIHKAGIIHRDISPDNIMYLYNGSVKLTDFGAARMYSADQQSLSIILKHGYAPMEQYSRGGDQGPWTDVYALCATIYTCITGITPADSIDRAFDDTLKRPSQLGVAITPEMENALMYGLAVKKEERCQSITELLNRLNQTASVPVTEVIQPVQTKQPVRAKQPVQAKQPAPTLQQTEKKPRKKLPWIIASIAAVLVVGIVVAAIFVIPSILSGIKPVSVTDPSVSGGSGLLQNGDNDETSAQAQEPGEYTVYDYSSDGDVIRSTTLSSSDLPIEEENYLFDGYISYSYYDEDGKIIERDMYDSTGAFLTKRLFTYNNAGKMQKEIRYNADQSMRYFWTVEYDDDGVAVSGIKYDANGNALAYRSYEADSHGNVVKETFYNTDHEATSYFTYSYDFEGCRISQVKTDVGSTDDTLWESECDTHKHLWRSAEHSGDKIKTAYYFDSQGNMVGYFAFDANGNIIDAN